MNRSKIKKAKDFDELLDIKYGKLGTEKREAYERKAKAYVKKTLKNTEPKKEISYFGACPDWDIEAAELRAKSNKRLIKW